MILYLCPKNNLPREFGEALKAEAGQESNATLEARITPPDGSEMSQDELDQAMLEATEDVSEKSDNYDARGEIGPNSNTIVDNKVESTGAVMPDINGATGQNCAV